MGLLDDHQAYQTRIAEIQSSLWQAHEALRAAYQLQKTELVEYKAQAHYWEAQFGQIKNREATLQEEIAELKAKLRLREQQLFGRKSEKSTSRADTERTPEPTTRKRGQQPESAGHGRRDYASLPTIEETYELEGQERQCIHCGLLYEEHGTTEEPNVIEIINVQGYRRRIIRKTYQRTCCCRDAASRIDAPGPPRVLPESRLGVSIWAYILTQKFRFQLPLNRILQSLATHGLSLAAGTVTDGLRKLLPLLTPVFDAMVEHNTQASHWHADETGWKVFASIDGKLSTKWYLWLFQSHDSVVYKCCPSRSSQVLLSHFGEDHPGGTLSVDRYSAYKVIAKSGVFVLAFCWAHVRRDFLNYSKNYPSHEAWGLSWVESIDGLYRLNNERIQQKPYSKAFRQCDKALREQIRQMEKTLKTQLADKAVVPSARKLLVSLEKHWAGLTIFVDQPDIPMDNNTAERALRNPVVGRKNYYGSAAVWSSELAAVMFTLEGTLKLWNMNLQTWLTIYLQACAHAQSHPPQSIDKFLPWNMSEEQRQLFAKPPD